MNEVADKLLKGPEWRNNDWFEGECTEQLENGKKIRMKMYKKNILWIEEEKNEADFRGKEKRLLGVKAVWKTI